MVRQMKRKSCTQNCAVFDIIHIVIWRLGYKRVSPPRRHPIRNTEYGYPHQGGLIYTQHYSVRSCGFVSFPPSATCRRCINTTLFFHLVKMTRIISKCFLYFQYILSFLFGLFSFDIQFLNNTRHRRVIRYPKGILVVDPWRTHYSS